ncbi:hypothetical protein ACFWY6_22930, partial [Streptomyces sp. NPDC059037]
MAALVLADGTTSSTVADGGGCPGSGRRRDAFDSGRRWRLSGFWSNGDGRPGSGRRHGRPRPWPTAVAAPPPRPTARTLPPAPRTQPPHTARPTARTPQTLADGGRPASPADGTDAAARAPYPTAAHRTADGTDAPDPG